MDLVNADNSMSKKRKRYWCVEYYDYEFGYNSWGDFLTLKEASEYLEKLEKEMPSRKWNPAANAGFLIKERLLHEDQVKKIVENES